MIGIAITALLLIKENIGTKHMHRNFVTSEETLFAYHLRQMKKTLLKECRKLSLTQWMIKRKISGNRGIRLHQKQIMVIYAQG